MKVDDLLCIYGVFAVMKGLVSHGFAHTIMNNEKYRFCM